MKPNTEVAESPPATHSPSRRAQKGPRTMKAMRAEAMEARTHLHAMQALTDTALSYLSLDDLLRELLGRVTAVMQVDQIAIFLLDEDGQTLSLRAARGVLEEAIGRAQVTEAQGVVGRIAASREPLIVNAPSDSDFHVAPPLLREQMRALVGVPLLVADPIDGKRASRLVGVIAVGSTTPRAFGEADVQLLQRVADRTAMAVDHALVYAAEQDARRRAQAALARALMSEAQASDRAHRLHIILETIADGVSVYDAAGRPVQTNPAYRELLALERGPATFESLSALDRTSLLHLRDLAGTPLPVARNPIARALRGDMVAGQDADVLARAFDGRELELNASAAPMRGPDGRVVGAVLVLRDLTQHNRLEREREAAHASEEAAHEASRHMEQFVATAAHDLRTPLGTTVGYLALAQRRAEGLAGAVPAGNPELAGKVAAVRARLDEADHSAARLSRLLNILFDTAAIRAGRLELHRTPFDLVALVREQVEAQRLLAPERTIRLRLPAGGEPVLVEADVDRVGEVVTNYVTNALKYSPPDLPVHVSVAVRSGCGRVAVRDRGPGIPKAEQAHVWELFHRAAGAAKQGDTTSGSLGLGLYISRAIIEAHEGQVGVKSAVGKGSTFWFTLPLSGVTLELADQ